MTREESDDANKYFMNQHWHMYLEKRVFDEIMDSVLRLEKWDLMRNLLEEINV